MRPFVYQRASNSGSAVDGAIVGSSQMPGEGVQFLAGGTTLLDLMKLDVLRPKRVIDINDLGADLGAVEPAPRACGSERWCAWPMPPTIR